MKGFSKFAPVFALFAVACASGQFRGFQAAAVSPPPPLELQAGKTAEASIYVRIRSGYHINSDKPAEQYLIPTRLTWNTDALKVVKTTYPEAELFISEFSEEALLVYSGEVVFKTTFEAPAKLPAGLTEISGTLRYQACNDKACLAPTSADFTLPIRSK